MATSPFGMLSYRTVTRDLTRTVRFDLVFGLIRNVRISGGCPNSVRETVTCPELTSVTVPAKN